MRNYEKLNIVSFGEHLIKSQDLDPVYPALTKLFPKRHKSMTEFNKLSRWLIAYWCFYHCGFASYASELGEGFFWDVLMDAAQNEVPTPMGTRWPRGHERRHARGSQGIKMVQHLKELYGNQPEFMVTHICSGAPIYSRVADLVQKHTLFGPETFHVTYPTFEVTPVIFHVWLSVEVVLFCKIILSPAFTKLSNIPTSTPSPSTLDTYNSVALV